MSSRSIGVTKLRSMRRMIECVSSSASCSTSLIAATCFSRFPGSAKSCLSSRAATDTRFASSLNISKNASSRGISRTGPGLR